MQRENASGENGGAHQRFLISHSGVSLFERLLFFTIITDYVLCMQLITQVDYVCYSLLGFDPLRTLMYGDVIEAPQPLSMNAVRMLDAPPWLL